MKELPDPHTCRECGAIHAGVILEPVQSTGGSRWACGLCGRYHWEDGSLYFKPGAARNMTVVRNGVDISHSALVAAMRDYFGGVTKPNTTD